MGVIFLSYFFVFVFDRVWVFDDIKVKVCRKLKNVKIWILLDYLFVFVDIELF